jgi:hypothetical protein
MKTVVRFILVLTVLVGIAQPTFACVICDFTGNCTWGGGLRCKILSGGCSDGGPCGGGLTEPLAADFTIASVQVTHGADTQLAQSTKRETAPAAVAYAHLRKNRK